MTASQSDRLVTSGKLFTRIIQTFIGFSIGIFLLAVAIHFMVQFANLFGYDGEPIIDSLEDAVGMLAGLLILTPLYWFFGRLDQIIDSLASDQIFSLDNAAHLKAMAWYFLASQIAVSLATTVNFIFIARDDEEALLDNGIELALTLPSFLIVIVLFILAEVFRRAAQMRDDLEGTV